MKKVVLGGLLTLALCGTALPQERPPAAIGSGPAAVADLKEATAEVVLERALEAARRARQDDPSVRYRFSVRSVNEELTDEGRSKKTESAAYESFPIGGFAFQRLVEKDGRKPSPNELAQEDRKERAFRKKVAQGKDPRDRENQVDFDRDLSARFDFALEPDDEVHGRRCWVLSFKPKPGRLPVKRRMDRALNKSSGRIWVDRQTDEISRVEFQLREKVRIWGGLVGNVSQLEGRLERKPVDVENERGDWMPASFHFKIKGRILFSGLNSRIEVRWSDFEPASPRLSAQPE